MKKLNIGDIVTVKEPVQCYYSGYAGRPVKMFNSGDTARVVSYPAYPGIPTRFYFCKPTSFLWDEGLAIDIDNIKKL